MSFGSQEKADAKAKQDALNAAEKKWDEYRLEPVFPYTVIPFPEGAFSLENPALDNASST